MSDAYDSQGRLASSTTVVNGQLVSETDYDSLDLSAWRSSTTDYDGQGRAYRKLVTYDDSRIVETDTDTDGSHAWSSLVSGYTSGHLLDFTQTTLRDGSRIYHDYDQANAETWSGIDDYYDRAGRLDDTYIAYDDGSRTRVHYDVAGDQAFKSWTQHFDAQGREASISYDMDDGTSQVYTYDTDGTKPYSVIQENYKDGKFTSRAITYDDGSHDYLYYTGPHDLVQIGKNSFSYGPDPFVLVSHVDPQGRMTSLEKIYGDNSHSVTSYDVDNSQPWTTTTLSYKGDGQLYGSSIAYDDGTTADASYTVHYDGSQFPSTAPDGNPQSVTYDDRHVTVVVTDVNNVELWSTETDYYGNGGDLYETLIKFDDGSVKDTSLYGPGTDFALSYNYSSSNGLLVESQSYDQSGNGSVLRDHPLSQNSIYYYRDAQSRLYKEELYAHDSLVVTSVNNSVDSSNDLLNWMVEIDSKMYGSNIIQSYKKTYYDHTSSYVQFDVTNKQYYTSYTELYDAFGVIIKTISANDDGSVVTTTYDPGNLSDHAYDVTTTMAGVSHTQTVFDDGHSTAT